ncbi:hypothetical protein COT72_00780 [archaeon CG10_big_fil_rev_8_21_14_0_10_43_11]|nr:MAG: hypothetical protein COT72_00780 [archaeon CG10_big_fil_rev_8_21_14_0_10_43_11]
MKRLLALMVLGGIFFSSAHALAVSVVDPTTYPLTSNQPFSITVKVFNDGVTKLEDYSVGIQSEYPYKSLAGEVYTQKIGDINGKETILKTFRFLTYDNVIEGSYPLKVFTCTGQCGAKSFAVQNLQFSGSANIQISQYSFNTSELAPGEVAQLTIQLKNYGLGLASDGIINLTNVVSSYTPFIFLDKPSAYYIGDIAVNQTKNVTFLVRVNDNITKGVYAMPVQINYDNIAHDLANVQFEIVSKANLEIFKIETEPLQPVRGSEFTVLISIENIGKGEATSTRISLEGDYIGERVSFIGSLDEHEDDIGLLRIFSLSGEQLTATLTYTDDLGTHTITQPITLTLGPAPPLSITPFILGVFALAGVLAYMFRKRIFKKKQ